MTISSLGPKYGRNEKREILSFPMNLRRKYENGLQTIARVDYAKYTHKILVFSNPNHIVKI